jgi:hypothetical protein
MFYRYSPLIYRSEALKPYLSAARWIPLGINPYANLTAVFFSGMQQDPEDEEVRQPSEMYVYAHYNMFALIKIAYSDQLEEEKIFRDIIKLVPSFQDLLTACHGHRRALLNLIRMVSFVFCIVSYHF